MVSVCRSSVFNSGWGNGNVAEEQVRNRDRWPMLPTDEPPICPRWSQPQHFGSLLHRTALEQELLNPSREKLPCSNLWLFSHPAAPLPCRARQAPSLPSYFMNHICADLTSQHFLSLDRGHSPLLLRREFPLRRASLLTARGCLHPDSPLQEWETWALQFCS